MRNLSPSALSRLRTVRPARRSWRGRSPRRGVSDVVATILILGITVTLFASLFAFVDAFPPPPPQAVNEFQAFLTDTANGSYIQSVSIRLTAGPLIAPSASVYLKSASNPTLPQFRSAIPVAWGINNTSVWSVGQTWVRTFVAPNLPRLPDNITIYVVSTSELLYSVTIPGPSSNLPPSITETGITPSTPAVGAAFEIYAGFTGNITGGTPTVSLTSIPGLSGTPAMAKDNGLYVYNVTAGSTTTAGSYYAFVSITNTAGQTATAEINVIITSSGGGTSSSKPSVIVGMSPQPPTYPQQSPTAYFWAAVTYPGSLAGVPVSVNFTIVQHVSGLLKPNSAPAWHNVTIPGQTGLTISGPSTLTVYSQTADNFNAWWLNTSVTITANATLGMSIGSVTGTIAFSTQAVGGMVYFTTSGTGATGSSITNSFSHSCTSSTCPFLYIEVFDNATAGPTPLSFSGTVTTNSTTGGHTHTYTIAATALTSAAPVFVNVVTAGSTTARWTSPGGSTGTVYTLSMWLTITYSGTTIGYAYDTFTATLT